MKSNKWFSALLRRRLFIALLLLIQLVTFVLAVIYSGRFYSVLSTALTLISLATALFILATDSAGPFKLTWIFVILTVPLFGGVVYIMFKLQGHTRKFFKRQKQVEQSTKPLYPLTPDTHDAACDRLPLLTPQINYLERSVGFPIYSATQTEYFTLGEHKFKALCEELKKAKRYIFIEYFIIQEGVMWDTVLDIPKHKAAEGVEVRIIYDDIGCFLRLPKNYAKRLDDFGIKCIVFNPFRPFFTAIQNNRDHRKIVSIDGEVAFTGGINLADEYINEIQRFGHWKDTAVMLRGAAAWSLTLMFLEMWAVAGNTAEDYSRFYPYGDKPLPQEGDGFVQPYCDTPMDRENVSEHIYLHILSRAQDYVYICTPYLIIDETMSSALTLAAKSGVDVRIITPHIPDKKTVHAATRSHYHELISAGVRIYEYSKGFMHSKTFVSDDRVATVGTANLDFRSLYLHFECGACLYDSKTVLDVKKDFLDTLDTCVEITPDQFKVTSRNRLLRAILRLYSPMM